MSEDDKPRVVRVAGGYALPSATAGAVDVGTDHAAVVKVLDPARDSKMATPYHKQGDKAMYTSEMLEKRDSVKRSLPVRVALHRLARLYSWSEDESKAESADGEEESKGSAAAASTAGEESDEEGGEGAVVPVASWDGVELSSDASLDDLTAAVAKYDARYLTRDAYAAVHQSLLAVLYPSASRRRKKKLVDRDWKRDAGDGKKLRYEAWLAGMAELVDLWTLSAEEEEYVAFAGALLYKLTRSTAKASSSSSVTSSRPSVSSIDSGDDGDGEA
eukprot:PLAT10149.1.p1 GENE.PLAT10149.1~~PLAT10149.1.p1  ORF type:complete len:274 (+),score=75.75 PLAT10149.1:51-872(+)